MPIALNIIQSQAAWFACVLCASVGRPWIGTTAALMITFVHVVRAPHPKRDLRLVLAAGAFGAAADSTLLGLGMLQFTSGVMTPGLSPQWMIALWMNFATVLDCSLRGLKTRLLLAIPLGALAGPIAYFAGMRLGALQIGRMPESLAAIALEWAIALPLLLWLARSLDRSCVSKGKTLSCRLE